MKENTLAGGALSRGKVTLLAVVAMVALSLLLVVPRPAHAKTFTVNSIGDGKDAIITNTACDASLFPGIQCTLRAAIEEANDTPGRDLIHFNIPGKEIKTIKPDSELPPIYDQVTINGYTQAGASPNTSANGDNAVLKIELDGTNAGDDAAGLRLGSGSSNSVVKGLAVNRFDGYGVVLSTSESKLQGTFIGTDPTGTLDRGNGKTGVYCSGSTSNNQIGGTTPQARNVISGNGSGGVLLYGSGHKVQGNFIGTKKNGTSDLGNAGGVAIATSGHTVGSGVAAGANVIAFNDLDGVTVFVCGTCTVFPTGNRILRNSIHSNLLGIDLTGGTESISGNTFNDPGDTDTGPNQLQNYPELTSATTSGGTTTIKGKLNSTPGKTFTLRFFSNPQGDPAEGKKYVGSKSVTTNSNGNDSFTFTPSHAVAVGQVITATATNPVGNTSEFSLGKQVS
jgi:CSLREA domain-containing protein